MEEKKLKIVKIILLSLYLVAWLLFLVIFSISTSNQRWPNISFLGYWLIFIGLCALARSFKLQSQAILAPSFILFVMGTLLASLSFNEIAEIAMRLSFVGWIVGLGQALAQYKK